MKTPERLEQALVKLYNAFHNNRLDPEDCTACAVGNILDNQDSWKHLSNDHGSLQLNYIGTVHQLLEIEKVFLIACGFETPLCHYNPKPQNPRDKETLFNGLCAVVSLLCELDDIPDVMDYSKLFEYEDDMPVYALNAVIT